MSSEDVHYIYSTLHSTYQWIVKSYQWIVKSLLHFRPVRFILESEFRYSISSNTIRQSVSIMSFSFNLSHYSTKHNIMIGTYVWKLSTARAYPVRIRVSDERLPESKMRATSTCGH